MSKKILFYFCMLCLRLLVCLRTIGTKNDSGTFTLVRFLPGDILLVDSRLLTAQRLMSIIFRDSFLSSEVYLFAVVLKAGVVASRGRTAP